MIIVVSAPSGSGKTTLVKRLETDVPGMRRSVSYTTRPPRDGEREGEDYVFIDDGDFGNKIKNGEFLEWEENFGNFYGTLRAQIEGFLKEGVDVILNVDVKGARSVKKEFPESISVFIMPPSPDELENRLRKRNTDQEQQVTLRLKESILEMASADEYDYLIVNEDLEKALEEFKTIITRERMNRERSGKKSRL